MWWRTGSKCAANGGRPWVAQQQGVEKIGISMFNIFVSKDLEHMVGGSGWRSNILVLCMHRFNHWLLTWRLRVHNTFGHFLTCDDCRPISICIFEGFIFGLRQDRSFVTLAVIRKGGAWFTSHDLQKLLRIVWECELLNVSVFYIGVHRMLYVFLIWTLWIISNIGRECGRRNWLMVWHVFSYSLYCVFNSSSIFCISLHKWSE